MLLLARPLLRRVAMRWATEPLPHEAVALVFVTLLLSTLTAEIIGIHAIFGAFLLGPPAATRCAMRRRSVCLAENRAIMDVTMRTDVPRSAMAASRFERVTGNP